MIGQYIEQLKGISRQFDAPLVTGKTPNNERDRLYGDFREGKLKLLVVSKVANFAQAVTGFAREIFVAAASAAADSYASG